MKGVKFGSLHSFKDFKLILSSKTIGSPSVKTETVNVPGADGELDFTEFFGEPKYSNRTITFEFSSIVPFSEQLSQDSTIKNALHGKKVKIILDSDSEFYYFGRISVGDWKNEKNVGKLTITCNCEPWKYKVQETIETFTIATSGYITLNNLRRSVIPKITTDSAITISWQGHSASLSVGEDWIIEELILKSGETNLSITGSGTITFKYQEGSL